MLSHMRTIILLLSLALIPSGVLAESAAGVQWTAPAGWTTQGPAPMRAATYTHPRRRPATRPAANAACISSARARAAPPTRTSIAGTASSPVRVEHRRAGKVAKRTVHGLAMTTIDVSGAYSGMGGPMAGASRTVPGYRLLGAIIEAPGGNVFIKLTGPAKTIAANQQKFELLLASFQRGR